MPQFKDAVATVSVADLQAARRFYEEVLDLKLIGEEGGEVLTFRSGNSCLFVYRSEFAGSNRATAVTWPVKDVENLVQQLKNRGVKFEHYDLPGLQRIGDLHVAEGMQAAWFKDPDGNIHALVNAA